MWENCTRFHHQFELALNRCRCWIPSSCTVRHYRTGYFEHWSLKLTTFIVIINGNIAFPNILVMFFRNDNWPSDIKREFKTINSSFWSFLYGFKIRIVNWQKWGKHTREMITLFLFVGNLLVCQDRWILVFHSINMFLKQKF